MTNITNITDMTAAALNRALAEEMGVVPKPEDIPIDRIVCAIKKSRKGDTYEYGIRAQFVWGEDKSAWTFPLHKETFFDSDRLANLIWEGRLRADYRTDIESYVVRTAYDPPPYSTDLVTAFTLGPAMYERGLSGQFVYHLRTTLNFDSPCPVSEFALAHATPRQRAEAALEALRGRVEE